MRRRACLQDVSVSEWSWPVDLSRYDRSPGFYPGEEEALARIRHRPRRSRCTYINEPIRLKLHRLIVPVHDSLNVFGATRLAHTGVASIIIQEMVRRRVSFWGWSEREWKETIGPDSRTFCRTFRRAEGYRMALIAVAYLLRGITDLDELGPFSRRVLAEKVFGRQRFMEAAKQIADLLRSWGVGASMVTVRYPRLIAELLLLSGSPRLADLTPEVMTKAREGDMDRRAKGLMVVFAKALSEVKGSTAQFFPAEKVETKTVARAIASGVPEEWAEWCVRWLERSTASPSKRNHVYYDMHKVGRWLADKHPEIKSPEQWTRELSIEWVACADRLTVGQYSDQQWSRRSNVGKALRPAAKQALIGSARAFFNDLQEWELIPRKFDPVRTLATPASIRRLVGPDPRVIEDGVWAKLLHAGLNLTAEDLPANACGEGRSVRAVWYPLEMVRALAAVWLFAGLRSDEIRRLRVGCIRRQDEDLPIHPTEELLPKGTICLLEVPTNKTCTAFTKPVDPIVGQAVAAWERVRPEQPLALDRKTGELVHYLFSYRGQRVGGGYLNKRLIQLLCRKAGVPERDARGQITSHRARSTLATQLYNAKNPMTLFELQEWLGHRSPSATQHYAKVKPTKLAKAYADADYFRRNLRTVEVLIDREAVVSGAALGGEPWKYYDLGHGYCTYDFFEQCVHRMICAKCDFYVPKESSRAQLLEAKTNLQRMMQEIPLREEERAAVEDGLAAVEGLCAKLIDTPTPAGPTPRELTTRIRRKLPVLPARTSR